MSSSQDMKEFITVQQHYGCVTSRCKGGRVVARDYICPHCESNNPPEKCLKPRKSKVKDKGKN